MVKISPTAPTRSLSDQRRELNSSRRHNLAEFLEAELPETEPLEGELLEAAETPTSPRQPPDRERRRGSDRRQHRTDKPYLDARCNPDRRRQRQASRIDITI